MQKSASMKPRASLSKFGGDSNHWFIDFHSHPWFGSKKWHRRPKITFRIGSFVAVPTPETARAGKLSSMVVTPSSKRKVGGQGGLLEQLAMTSSKHWRGDHKVTRLTVKYSPSTTWLSRFESAPNSKFSALSQIVGEISGKILRSQQQIMMNDWWRKRRECLLSSDLDEVYLSSLDMISELSGWL